MRVSAERHYESTRSACDTLMFVVASLAVGLLLYVFWRGSSLPFGGKLLVSWIAVCLAVWPAVIFSRLVCEIVRQCTTAECGKCRGPAKFDPSMEGSFSKQHVTYTCRQCGFQETLKARYADEAPKQGDGRHFDGGGGGGG